MKNIKTLYIVLFSAIVSFSCSNDTKENFNFIDFQSEELSLVVVKGESLGQEISVYSTLISSANTTYDLAINENTTLTTEGNTIPTQVTIPANSNSGKFSININSSTLKAEGQTLILDIVTPEGIYSGNSNEISIQLTCPLVNGAADLIGSWSGTDASYPNTAPFSTTTVLDDANIDQIKMEKLGQSFIVDFWEETLISSEPITLVIGLNGSITIPRQFVYTADYEGDLTNYEIEGSGEWQNCEDKPVMILKYDIYYPGDAIGIAADNNYPNGYLEAEITLE